MSRSKYNFYQVMRVFMVALFLSACGEKPQDLLVSAKDFMKQKDQKSAIIQIKNAIQLDPQLPEARFLLGLALLESGDPVGAETEFRKSMDLAYPVELVAAPLARSLLAQRHAKKIIDEFSKTELKDPMGMASLQMSLTSAYAILGKTDLSNEAMHAALKADPGFSPALLSMARQKAVQRDFDGALTLADAVITKSADDYEAWKFKGDIYAYAKNQAPQAVMAYKKAIEIKPEYFAGQAALTSLLLKQGNLPEAVEHIAQLQKRYPHHYQTKYLEAQLAFQQNNFKLSRELVRQVLTVMPKSTQALQLAGVVELQLHSLVKAEAYLSQAVQQGPELSLARRALILTYLRSGQPVKAMATLVPGLRRNVVDPELFSLAGEVYLQNGDPKKAEDYFAQAARQTPKDPQKRTALALAHLWNGSTESVFDELAAISSSDVDTTADLALISVHLRRQEIDKALVAIDRLEMKQPGMPLASNLRGRALLLKQEFSGARKSFEKSVTINPAYFPAVASLAALDMNDKKPEEAKKRFQSLLVKNPNHLQALLALAEISARTGGTKEEIAELLRKAIAAHPTDMVPRLLMGDLYLRFSDLKAALVVAQDAVIAMPESPTALDALGRALQALGAYDQAIVTYQKLAEMQPHSPQPHLRVADVYMLTKNREAVSRSLRRALEIAPDLLKAQSALYALAIDSKAYTDALALARLVQNKRPTEILGYAMEGNVYALQQNWSSAISVYRAGLKRVNSSELAIKLHTILLAHGERSEATVFAFAWQKNNPKDGYFLSYLGDISLARKDYVNAEAAYANVVKVQPNNAVALNNLAWVSAKLSKKEAISYAEKANALLPNQPAFMDTLSMLLLDHGSYEKAEEIQRKAVDIQPLNPSLKLNLAKIHIKTGKINLAKKELNDLAKLGDQFSAQAEVALLLRRL